MKTMAASTILKNLNGDSTAIIVQTNPRNQKGTDRDQMTTFVETRPSSSDGKKLSRRCICRKCGSEHWHRQTGPHTWKCGGCGATFTQNPWVSDGHPLIDAPAYEGETTCQKQKPAPTVMEPENARFVTDTEGYATIRTGPMKPVRSVIELANARSVMVQAAFL